MTWALSTGSQSPEALPGPPEAPILSWEQQQGGGLLEVAASASAPWGWGRPGGPARLVRWMTEPEHWPAALPAAQWNLLGR